MESKTTYYQATFKAVYWSGYECEVEYFNFDENSEYYIYTKAVSILSDEGEWEHIKSLEILEVLEQREYIDLM